MTADVSAVPTRAAELVAAGWVQGVLSTTRNGVPCYCASGAIIEAAAGIPWTDFASKPLHEAWRAFRDSVGIDPTCSSIPDWNDAPSRTQAEVVAALRSAAAETAA